MMIGAQNGSRTALRNALPVERMTTNRLAQTDDAIMPGDRFIVDLDGTLLCDGSATEGAHAFLRAVDGRFVLVSNNSRDTSSRLSARLRRIGLDIPAERMVLAGEEGIRFVAREYPGARCLIAASSALRHCARRHGLVPVPEHADVVVLGRDTHWNYAKLTLLANEVRSGAVLAAINPDLTHPGHNGRIVPETGSLLAGVEAAAGIAATHVIGKPDARLFIAAMDRLGSTHDTTIVIGDNPQTDRAGARALGLRSLIVHPDRQDGRPNLADLCDRLAAINTA